MHKTTLGLRNLLQAHYVIFPSFLLFLQFCSTFFLSVGLRKPAPLFSFWTHEGCIMRKDELIVQKGTKYSARYSWKDVCLEPLPFSYLLHDLGKCFVLFFFLILVGVYLFYSVVSVSAVQQTEPAVCIHASPLFWISFPFRSPHSVEQSLPRHTVRESSVLYLVSVGYIWQSQSPNSSYPFLFPLVSMHLFSASVSISVQQTRSSIPILSDSMYTL